MEGRMRALLEEAKSGDTGGGEGIWNEGLGPAVVFARGIV